MKCVDARAVYHLLVLVKTSTKSSNTVGRMKIGPQCEHVGTS